MTNEQIESLAILQRKLITLGIEIGAFRLDAMTPEQKAMEAEYIRSMVKPV